MHIVHSTIGRKNTRKETIKALAAQFIRNQNEKKLKKAAREQSALLNSSNKLSNQLTFREIELESQNPAISTNRAKYLGGIIKRAKSLCQAVGGDVSKIIFTVNDEGLIYPFGESAHF